MRLGRSTLEAILAFVRDASQLELDEPYSNEFLCLLQELVPATWIVYQEVDHEARTFISSSGIGPDTSEEDEDDEIYWAYGPCPTQEHRVCTGDLRAVRTSDLTDQRTYHRLPIYREYFRPEAIEHILDFGLPASPGRTRSLVFMRERGTRDFSERDREVIEALRPHLHHIEAHAQLRRELAEAGAGGARLGEGSLETGDDEGLRSILTQREREIVELVAAGKTNAEIATTLWIAPSTVKKHLENIYAKAGIGRRSAIVALHRTRGVARP